MTGRRPESRAVTQPSAPTPRSCRRRYLGQSKGRARRIPIAARTSKAAESLKLMAISSYPFAPRLAKGPQRKPLPP